MGEHEEVQREVAARLAAHKEEHEAARAAVEKARRERDLSHQLSWLKNALTPRVSDEALEGHWLAFRASVGDP